MAELKAIRRAIKYAISKNIMKVIFWANVEAIVGGFYINVTFVNTGMLPRVDKLKLTCKK